MLQQLKESALLTTEEGVTKIKAALGLDKSDYPWPVYTGMWGGSTSLEDLTDEQKNSLPEGQTAKLALPIVTVTEEHYYVFAIPRNTLNNAKLVYPESIFLNLLQVDASSVDASGDVTSSAETVDYKFFDDSGNVFTMTDSNNISVTYQKVQ